MTEQQIAASPAFAGLTPEQIVYRIAALNRANDRYSKHADDPGYPAWRDAGKAYPRQHRSFRGKQ